MNMYKQIISVIDDIKVHMRSSTKGRSFPAVLLPSDDRLIQVAGCGKKAKEREEKKRAKEEEEARMAALAANAQSDAVFCYASTGT